MRFPDLPAVWGNLRYRFVRRRLAAPKLLGAFANAYPEAFFVEIGSNDGEQHDQLRPLHPRPPAGAGSWSSRCRYVFARLQRNYGALAGRVALENVAIADRRRDAAVLPPRSRRPRRASPALPDWYDGIGSLSREAVLAHAQHIPDIAARLVEAEVPCLTYASLLERHGAGHVDLLLIDTEG